MSRRPRLIPALLLCPVATLCAPATQAVELLSVSTGAVPANGESRNPAVSYDGRYVVFESSADTLVAADGNGSRDVFLRDRRLDTTIRLSQTPAGIEGDAESVLPAISGDGTRIVFESFADNLASGALYKTCYLRDLVANTLTIVNRRASDGAPTNDCENASIDLAGSRVAFDSLSTDLVAGDTLFWRDVFVRDLAAGTTRRVSVGLAGAEANGISEYAQISGDGLSVSFASDAPNLVGADGNGKRDVFIAPVATGVAQRVSVGAGGLQTDGDSERSTLNFDGSILAFTSRTQNFTGSDPDVPEAVFVRVPSLDLTVLASGNVAGTPPREGSTRDPHLSADGRFLVFSSTDQLTLDDANGGSDVYVVDLVDAVIALVSIDAQGGPALGNSLQPKLTGDGSGIVFTSQGNSLVDNDGNGAADIFYVRNPLDPRLFSDGFED